MQDNRIMRKWVLTIALICLGCVTAQKAIDSLRPARPDEEMIANAVLMPKPANFLDRLKFADEIVYAFDDWKEPREVRSFEQILGIEISSLDRGVKNYRNDEDHGSNAESKPTNTNFEKEDRSRLAALLRIRKSIEESTESISIVPKISLNKLNLDQRIFLFPGSQWKGERTMLMSRSGKLTSVGYATHLEYPVFSRGRGFACLVSYTYYNHFSIHTHFLEKVRGSWRVVVETATHVI